MEPRPDVPPGNWPTPPQPPQQPWAATVQPTAQPAPGQQPWASDGPMASRLPIAHPWASSPYAYAAPLLLLPGRIRGSLSDYREGWICMAPEGMVLSGKGVLPVWIRTLLMLVGAVFCVGLILASFLVENALLQPRLDALPWDCVEEIVLDGRKGRMCVVYHLADAPTKPISLGLQLAPPPLFHHFAQVATHYLGPEKVHEGKIGSPTSPAVVWVLVAFLALVFIGVVVAIATSK